MATYIELRDLFGDGDIRKKIETAIAIASQIILSGGDTAAPFDQTAGAHDLRIKWANDALKNTTREAEKLHKYVLAANSELTAGQIQGASDSAIQSNVNGAIDAIATAVYGA